MYVHTLFRSTKTCKIEETGVFLVIFTNFGKHMREKFKKNMQKCIFRVYFHTWKICAYSVFFKSFYEDDIQPEQKCPPPRNTGYITFVKHESYSNCVFFFLSFLRGYCTSGPYFWRLRAFSQKIKQLRTKYPMDLVRKCSKELENYSFTSVETIVVKLQWKMCENQYFPCFEP